MNLCIEFYGSIFELINTITDAIQNRKPRSASLVTLHMRIINELYYLSFFRFFLINDTLFDSFSLDLIGSDLIVERIVSLLLWFWFSCFAHLKCVAAYLIWPRKHSDSWPETTKPKIMKLIDPNSIYEQQQQQQPLR